MRQEVQVFPGAFMKPKSKKDAWLMEHFSDPTDGNTEMTDRDARTLRKMWKRRRTKSIRQEGKKIDDMDV